MMDPSLATNDRSSTLCWTPHAGRVSSAATDHDASDTDHDASLDPRDASTDPRNASTDPRDASTVVAGPAVALAPGTRLPDSHIELQEQIGAGATAEVFRGRHVVLERPLAIKVLRHGASWPGARARFLSEARISTELDSPYVVDVVDFGSLSDGRLWSAMEMLDGRTLADALDRGPLSPERCVSLLRMACKGLHAAHTAGIIHRDIKPENLMLVERRGNEHLVIVDFGIATSAGPSEGDCCGTPRYMAPEQVRGETLDARADLYALGCCAFEMLTGKTLVSGSTVKHLLEAHVDGVAPVFPPELEIPRSLQLVVERCLHRDRERRHASAADLEAALCEAQLAANLRCLTDALPPPELDDADRRRRLLRGFSRPTRTAAPRRLLGAVAGLLCFSVVAAGWAAGHSDDDVSTVPHDAAARPLAAGLVARPLPEPVIGSERDTEHDHQLAALVEVKAADSGVVRSALPPAPPATFSLAAPANEPEAAQPSREDRNKARSSVREGRRAMRRGDPQAARKAFRRALVLDDRGADAYAGLADLSFDAGQHREALGLAKQAVRRAPGNPKHRMRLGDSYVRLSKKDKARQEYARAAALGSPSAKRRLEAL